MGFEFFETMSGSYAWTSAPHDLRALSFSVRAVVPDIAAHLRDRRATLAGAIDADGLAHFRPLHGTLIMDPLFGRRLVYDFRFTADDGRELHFWGQKTVKFLHLLATMTTLTAELRDAHDVTVATARLRFDARSDLRRWLKSFRRT